MKFRNFFTNRKFWRKVHRHPLFAQGHFDSYKDCWVVAKSRKELDRSYNWAGPFPYINPLSGQKVIMYARRDLVNESMKLFLEIDINF